MEQKSLNIAESPGPPTPTDLLQMAVSQNADLAKLEKLMELQERWEQNEARKAYHVAMAAFKKNPPEIEKDKKVGFQSKGGGTSYNHASLANVTGKINKALSEHGLSAAWRTDQDERGITVTCTITHKMGHSEGTSLSASADNTGNKNSIQAIGSTITYLERYTLLALTGLATKDMDDDGVKAEVKFITKEQENTLHAMLNENDLINQLQGVLNILKVKSLSEIPANKYPQAENIIKGKIAHAKRNI